jgi:phenylalanyl-tRNA synthetase beta subunit
VVSFKKKAQEAKLKNQKSFNAVVDEMEAILLDSGIPVHDIAIGTNSMGGTTMIAKLPGNKYVSFGLSDAAKFAALKSD